MLVLKGYFIFFKKEVFPVAAMRTFKKIEERGRPASTPGRFEKREDLHPPTIAKIEKRPSNVFHYYKLNLHYCLYFIFKIVYNKSTDR